MADEAGQDDRRYGWAAEGLGVKIKRLLESEVHFIHVKNVSGCSVGVVTSIRDLGIGLITAVVFNSEIVHPAEVYSGRYSQDLEDIVSWHFPDDHPVLEEDDDAT